MLFRSAGGADGLRPAIDVLREQLAELLGARRQRVDAEHAEALLRDQLAIGSEILISQGPRKNPRRLTPRECAKLMGYPDDFKILVSDTQAYRQFGNSVVVPVVERVAKRVIEALQRPVGYRPDLVLMDRKGEAPVVPKPPKKPVHYKIQRKK